MAKFQIVLDLASDAELAAVTKALSGIGLFRDGEVPKPKPSKTKTTSKTETEADEPAKKTPAKASTKKNAVKNKEKAAAKSAEITNEQLQTGMRAYKKEHGADELDELLKKYDVDRASKLSASDRFKFAVDLGVGQ